MEDTALFDAIDAVYAAALDRFRWPDSLGSVAAGLGAHVAMLLAPPPSGQGRQIFAAAGLPDPLIEAYNTHWHNLDPFVGRGGAAGATGATVATVGTVGTVGTTKPGETGFSVRTVHVDEHRGPFTNFFSEPAGCRSGLVAVGPEPEGLAVAFWRSGDRRFGPREEDFLRRLWPHIVRARRIQETPWDPTVGRRGSQTEAVLDLWPIGVIGFSIEGRQLYANQAALGIAAAADGLTLTVDGPVAAMPRDTRTLRETIRHVGDAGNPEWLRLPRPSGARPYEVAVCRVDPASGEAAVMLFIAESDTPVALDAMALRRLHGLTDLEVRIVECVVRGLAVADIAASQRLTPQTTRWYVQQVRQKLGATSQSELVRILIRGVAGLTIRSGSGPRQKN